MLDEISSITARIGEIQGRIAALSGPPPVPPLPADAPTFQQALDTAQAPAAGSASATAAPSSLPALTGPTTLPTGSDVTAPPASLGPLPTGPLAPLPVMPASMSSAAGIDGLVQKYAAAYGLEPALVQAVIKTESDGNPHCVSRAGAMGLMQLMPANVKEAGISNPFDPEQNISAGTKQLADLLGQYHGDLDLALAGYNAGPGNVHKYGGVPPFTETRHYIQRVRAAMGQNMMGQEK